MIESECVFDNVNYKMFTNIKDLKNNPSVRGICLYIHQSLKSTEMTVKCTVDNNFQEAIRVEVNGSSTIGCLYRPW